MVRTKGSWQLTHRRRRCCQVRSAVQVHPDYEMLTINHELLAQTFWRSVWQMQMRIHTHTDTSLPTLPPSSTCCTFASGCRLLGAPLPPAQQSRRRRLQVVAARPATCPQPVTCNRRKRARLALSVVHLNVKSMIIPLDAQQSIMMRVRARELTAGREQQVALPIAFVEIG